MNAPVAPHTYIHFDSPNTRYPEATIKSFNTNNILDCNTACDNEPTCIGYVYNKAPWSSMGQCVLKSSLVGSNPVYTEGSMTYIRTSTGTFTPINAPVNNFTPSSFANECTIFSRKIHSIWSFKY